MIAILIYYMMCIPDGLLYAVTAPTDNLPGSGFTIDLHDKDAQIIAMWAPKKEVNKRDCENGGLKIKIVDNNWTVLLNMIILG